MIKPARKIWRLFGLTFPIIYFFQPKQVTLTILGIVLGIFLIIELIRFSQPKINKNLFKKLSFFIKKKEKKKISTSTLFLISTFFTFLLFPKELAIISIFFFIFGDALAEIIGIKYGRIKLFRDRNVEGTLACLISCMVIGIIFANIFDLRLIVVTVGALVTTALSIIPSGKLDDNLTMPFISALIMFLI